MRHAVLFLLGIILGYIGHQAVQYTHPAVHYQPIEVRSLQPSESITFEGEPAKRYTLAASLGADGRLYVVRFEDRVQIDPDNYTVIESRAWPVVYLETYAAMPDGRIAIVNVTEGQRVGDSQEYLFAAGE